MRKPVRLPHPRQTRNKITPQMPPFALQIVMLFEAKSAGNLHPSTIAENRSLNNASNRLK
jgi:hypothetical protein